MKVDRIGIVLLALACGTACSTHRFDRFYEARRYLEAAQIFDRDSSLHTRERALFRAGIIRASPRTAAYDPDAARNLLVRLLELYPNTVHREEALRALALLIEIKRLEASQARRDQTIEGDVHRLRAQVQELERSAELLRALNEKLERDLRNREKEIRALKAIDLRPDSASPPTRPDTTRHR